MRKATLAAAATLIIAFSTPALAGYDGWVAGGMGVYSATSMSASEAKEMAIAKCSAAEGVDCAGAFALSSGTEVVSAHCVMGDTSGYVVGSTKSAVEKMIDASAFSMDDCAMM